MSCGPYREVTQERTRGDGRMVVKRGYVPNRQWRIEIDAIPPAEIRGNAPAHPIVAGKTKRKWREEGEVMVIHDGVFHDSDLGLEKVKITFTFHHWRHIDLDNLTIGMKAWVDGLVDAGLISNDTPDKVTYGEHQFVKVKKDQAKTEVLIEELCMASDTIPA